MAPTPATKRAWYWRVMLVGLVVLSAISFGRGRAPFGAVYLGLAGAAYALSRRVTRDEREP